MMCPECGTHARVVDSRDELTDHKRVRRCARGHKFATFEFPLDQINALREAAGLVPITEPNRRAHMRGNDFLFKEKSHA